MTVYDVMDHYGKFGSNWLKVVEKGASIKDLSKIYSGVDVVAGFPVWYFWEEFHKAHPEAKVSSHFQIAFFILLLMVFLNNLESYK